MYNYSGTFYTMQNTSFTQELDATLVQLRTMLIAKNQAYGDSALNPVRIFSKADPIEQLKVRLDDKLSRIARGSEMGRSEEHTSELQSH